VDLGKCAGSDWARPFARRQPTPDAEWALRVPTSRAERGRVSSAVARQREAVRAARISEPGRPGSHSRRGRRSAARFQHWQGFFSDC
jgi:hypothetical protein